MESKKCVQLSWIGLALATSLVLSLPYLASLQYFFDSDDWVHLSFNSAIPPCKVWHYFSSHVIWFYRPLQSLQFGWLYHMAGFQPLPYNLCLLAMHLGVCLLVFTLACHLTTRGVALLATALFAAQWVYVDVVIWRSNYSTLHWALITLALSVTYLRYLESRRPALLAAVYALFLLNFLAKETAVTSPLLLAALWWWRSSAFSRSTEGKAGQEFMQLIGPFVLLTAFYLGFHERFVQDVYQGYVKPSYRFASPWQALRQTLLAFNHLLLSWYQDPVLLPLFPQLQAGVQTIVQQFLILPVVPAATAWWRRDRVLCFSLMWSFATLIPTVWLTTFHQARFYYLPAFGSALLLATAVQRSWQYLSAGTPCSRPIRLVLPVALAYAIIANVAKTTLLCFHDQAASERVRTAFSYLQDRRKQFPPGSLVVIKDLSSSYFTNGIGVTEMVRIGLQDQSANGVLQEQKLSLDWSRRLNEIPTAYLLDCGARAPLLSCLWDRRTARHNDPEREPHR